MPTSRKRLSVSIIAISGSQNVTGGISGLKERLLRMDGVNEVEYNYAANKLTVKYDESVIALSEIRNSIQDSMQT